MAEQHETMGTINDQFRLANERITRVRNRVHDLDVKVEAIGKLIDENSITIENKIDEHEAKLDALLLAVLELQGRMSGKADSEAVIAEGQGKATPKWGGFKRDGTETGRLNPNPFVSSEEQFIEDHAPDRVSNPFTVEDVPDPAPGLHAIDLHFDHEPTAEEIMAALKSHFQGQQRDEQTQ